MILFANLWDAFGYSFLATKKKKQNFLRDLESDPNASKILVTNPLSTASFSWVATRAREFKLDSILVCV
jgi:hypothetical protein